LVAEVAIVAAAVGSSRAKSCKIVCFVFLSGSLLKNFFMQLYFFEYFVTVVNTYSQDWARAHFSGASPPS